MHLVPVQPSFSRPPPLLFRHQLQCLNGLSSGRGRCSGEVSQAALPRDDPAHPSQHPLVHLLAVPASLSWQLSRTISGTGRHVRRNPILPNDCSLSPHVWSTAADKPALTGSYKPSLNPLDMRRFSCHRVKSYPVAHTSFEGNANKAAAGPCTSHTLLTVSLT